MRFVIDKKDLGYIKMFPNDEHYDFYRGLKNAQIIGEGEDEYIVFYTINKKWVDEECLDKNEKEKTQKEA